jgi:subtilisin family serine protease
MDCSLTVAKQEWGVRMRGFQWLIAAWLGSAYAWAGGCPDPDGLFQGGTQVIVRLSPGITPATATAIIQQHYPSAEIVPDDVGATRNVYVFGGFEGGPLPSQGRADAAADFLCSQYAAHPGCNLDEPPIPGRPFLWIEANYDTEAAEGHTGSIYDSRPQLATIYAGQYLVGQLGLELAQSRSTGRGVLVAVLDTGIDATHSLLAGRVVPGGRNFVLEAEANGNPRGASDTRDLPNGLDSDGDAAIDEMTGHGTYMAGLIALVAPEAGLMPIVVLNSDGVGSSISVARGIWHAIDRGAKVINASLGSTYDSAAVLDAVSEAYLRGITVVGAAGNRQSNCREFPAGAELTGAFDPPTAIGVAAVSIADALWASSNRNGERDAGVWIAAPGVSERLPGDPTEFDLSRSIVSSLPGETYGIWEGTSLSAAMVSGAAAMVYAQNRTAPPHSSTAVLLRQRLAIGAAPVSPAGAVATGSVRVDQLVNASPPQPREGDVNGDGHIDLADLALVLIDFGAPSWYADADGDGRAGLSDLAIVLGRFGT